MKNPVSASSLTQRVTLQKPVYVRDELGGALATWQDAATLWAHIRPLSGNEAFVNRQVQGVQRFEILLRYRDDVKINHRLRAGERIFHILSVEDVEEEGHTLRIAAEEIR